MSTECTTTATGLEWSQDIPVVNLPRVETACVERPAELEVEAPVSIPESTVPAGSEGEIGDPPKITKQKVGGALRRNPPSLGFRLRRRGYMTYQVQRAVENSVAPFSVGGQTSHWAVSNWLQMVNAIPGAKLAGGERVEYPVREGQDPSTDWVLNVVLGGAPMKVSLSALSQLHTYAVFRERTLDLIPALRTRFSQYAKEMRMPVDVRGLLISGTVALAMQVMPQETIAWDTLAGDAGRNTDEFGADFRTGTVPNKYVLGSKFLSLFAGGLEFGRVLPRARK